MIRSRRGGSGAVSRQTGRIDNSFQFQRRRAPGFSARGARGRRVERARDRRDRRLLYDCGNTRIPWCVNPPCGEPSEPEPSPSYSLRHGSRADKDARQCRVGVQGRPPFDHTTVTPIGPPARRLMSTSCGELITSVQKDGWSYAVEAGNGSLRWQSPRRPDLNLSRFSTRCTGTTITERPGAAWNDVFIVRGRGRGISSTITRAVMHSCTR